MVWIDTGRSEFTIVQVDQHSWKRSWWYFMWISTGRSEFRITQVYKCPFMFFKASDPFIQCKKDHSYCIEVSSPDCKICTQWGRWWDRMVHDLHPVDLTYSVTSAASTWYVWECLNKTLLNVHIICLEISLHL